jgi:hypothetical protein
MYYLDYELQRYQDAQEMTCDYCGESIEEEYYDCTCEHEEE